MANTAHLFRRQSSRDLVPSSYHNQRSIDNLELKVSKIYIEKEYGRLNNDLIL